MSAQGQEISTIGYPIEQEDGTDLRATLVVNGPVSDGQGHTTAIDGMLNYFFFGYFWSTTTAYYSGALGIAAATAASGGTCGID